MIPPFNLAAQLTEGVVDRGTEPGSYGSGADRKGREGTRSVSDTVGIKVPARSAVAAHAPHASVGGTSAPGDREDAHVVLSKAELEYIQTHFRDLEHLLSTLQGVSTVWPLEYYSLMIKVEKALEELK